MQQGLLPLFPLEVVLFPGGHLPLHIFEDRYKEMIGEILRDKVEFGVVLASEKGLAGSGCTATIEKVLNEYPDGRLDILTAGRRRFEVLLLNQERSFLRGTVEFFDDEPSEPAIEVKERAIQGYNQMQALTSGDLLAGDPPAGLLSFRLAQPIPDLEIRQLLLSSRSEAERLRRLADFFPAYVLKERHVQHAKMVAPKNGHGHTLPDLK